MEENPEPSEINFEFNPDTIIPDPEPKSKRGFWSIMLEAVETIGLALILFLGINAVSARIRVFGPSMEPTFIHGDYVIVSRVSYIFGEMQRGDVIIFPNPNNPEEDFIKRIVGLPGDTVEVRDHDVLVNGQLINEPYIKSPPARDMKLMLVPPDGLFVMGDNRNDSSDSRAWGILEGQAVIGKAVFTYWPFDEFGVVTHYDLLPTQP